MGTPKICFPCLGKKNEHNVSLGVVDSRDCFKSTIVKWKKIATLMMGCGHNAHVKNGPTCKEKWTTLYNDYKWIWDYMVEMGRKEKFLDMFVLQIKSPWTCLVCSIGASTRWSMPSWKQGPYFNHHILRTSWISKRCCVQSLSSRNIMCEVDLDPKPIHTMFNVIGNFISNLATPTTIPYNPTTPVVVNNLVTFIVLLNENASAHHDVVLL